MKALLIDTSTEKSFIAVGQLYPDGKILEEIELTQPSSKTLFPALKRVFSSDIQVLVVGVGPGSYTGIRVGVAAAKAIAFAKNLPLISVSTIEAFTGPIPYVSVIDARFSGVYAAFPNSDAQLYSIDEFHKACSPETVIVSPHPEILKKRLKCTNYLEKFPESRFLLQKAKVKWENDDYSMNAEAKILYLKETQAESELKRKRAVE